MNATAKKHLFDILNCINDVQEIIVQTPAFGDYQQNKTVRFAVERLLGTIGEATVRLEREVSQELFSNIRQITGLRNRLIHAYDDINDAVIWRTVHESLPELKREVEALLDDKTQNT